MKANMQSIAINNPANYEETFEYWVNNTYISQDTQYEKCMCSL